MDNKFFFVGGALLLCQSLNLNAGEKGAESGESGDPNIIFILCDDLGYGDLGCYGQSYIRTPNLDRMAAEGMRFTQAYSGSPVSAPSRACLMTGQHTGHTEVRGNREYWPNAPRVQYGDHSEYAVSGQHPYDADHIILPEIMKRNGYATGMFGKWAGGYEGSVSTPDKRGIDEYFGYICQYQAHLYYPNFLNRFSVSKGDTATVRILLEENIKYPMFGDGYEKRPQYSADMIHRAALEWIEDRNPDQPFFGIFTYTLPHAELVQPEDSILRSYKEVFFEDKTWGGTDRYNPTTHTHAQFAAMVTRLDHYVGEILAKLEEKGFDENTIVFFASDNGPHAEGGADPEFFGRDSKLRGIKRETHEGGIRVPFIVRWPGKIQAGAVNGHQLAFYDMIPTLCELAGDEGFPERYINKGIEGDCFDGISFVPTLLGDDDDQQRHTFLYWEFSETDQIAVRCGDWKLVVKGGTPYLYDLAADLHEDNDVASEHPELVRAMVDIIYREHRDSRLFPVTLPEKLF